VLFLLLVAAYVLAPGHPDAVLAGVPIGQTGIAVLVALTLLGCIRTTAPPRLGPAAVALLIALKLVLSAAVPPTGWLADYFANDSWAGPRERSVDFPGLEGTRIDAALGFEDTSFPVHFFNERRFDRGFRREYTEPFTVRWTAHTETDGPVRLTVHVRGEAVVRLDGEEHARIASTGPIAQERIDVTLHPGWHVLQIDYRKPAETEGVFALRGTPGEVWPHRPHPWQAALSMPLLVVSVLSHLIVLSVLVWVSFPWVRAWITNSRTIWRHDRAAAALIVLPALIVLGLTLQGLWKSRHLVGHVWTLTGGDDWMTFEHNARDILLNGALMTQGASLGAGSAYFAYPGYTYFVALVHAISGESLAGVVLMNFVVLGVATVLTMRLAQLLVSPAAALLGTVWLLALQQLDFVRYYTVTLLSENLFFATSAALVLLLTRYLVSGRPKDAAGAGLWGGVSAITRPSAMLVLPLAAVMALWTARAHARRRLAVALLLVSAWLAAIAPVTIRNYIVTGEPVLISGGQAKSFIDYNMPPERQQFYIDMFEGTLGSAAIVLMHMFVDQPEAVLRATWRKVGFSLGMTQWGSGVGMHPELLMTSMLYLVGFIVVPASRLRIALPLHAFVLTHLLAVTLSLPWNYGYRMILPMYPFMTIFAMAVPTVMLAALMRRRVAAATQRPEARTP
jgi:hypothetical protein